MRHVWYAITDAANVKASSPSDVINYSLLILPLHVRLLGVAAAGVTLYTLFDASYTIAAILLSFPAHYKRDKLTEASSTNNIATAPPLNPLAATEARSIRGFWSKTWHRLFARLFLIWGARPGEVVAKALGSKSGDWGKVLGAFAASAVVHGQAERAALGARSMERYNFFGIPLPLGGEPLFFMLSAVGILIEEAVKRPILASRKRRLLLAKAGSEEADAGMERWYDRPIGYLWTCVRSLVAAVCSRVDG